MTDTKLLSDEISKSGMTVTFIARKIGITREGFYKKLNNETEFKASEIVALQSILRLSNKKRDEIFFAKKVEWKSTIKNERSEYWTVRKFPSDKYTVNAYMILKSVEEIGMSYREAIISLERAEVILEENQNDLLQSTKVSIPFGAEDIMN